MNRWLAIVLIGGALEAAAQTPKPPSDVAWGLPASQRFEFAEVPELVFVRGIPETMQLGIYQLDPANRWTPGDFTRASGWTSRQTTRLVNAANGEPISGLSYTSSTAELSYGGLWSGDLTVWLERGTVKSKPFRIRVLTPTIVFGSNAAAINTERGWNARVCEYPAVSFSTCRSQFVGGGSDVAPMVMYATPGSYTGDFYMGDRPYSYVLGSPSDKPVFNGDAISGGQKRTHYLKNLKLVGTMIGMSHVNHDGPNNIYVIGVDQCCQRDDQQSNGLSNPNSHTTHPWSVWWHSSTSQGMGGTGNTTHSAYVEGRPYSIFDVNNLRLLGSQGCSGIKTTMQDLRVRHSLITVSEIPGTHEGLLMHTPIDVPGYSEVTIYGNRFEGWRRSSVDAPTAGGGLYTGFIFIRLRQATWGSDRPAYPTVSWSPPASTFYGLSPGKGWSRGPETYANDAYWQDIRSMPLDDPANVLLYRHYVSFNHFVLLPGSLSIQTLRDDGTFAATAEAQFSPWVIIKRQHPLAVERSMNFTYGNTFEGMTGEQPSFNLKHQHNVRQVDPLAAPFWPRDKPEEFPRAKNLVGDFPSWFPL